jgi:hypothetical protein
MARASYNNPLTSKILRGPQKKKSRIAAGLFLNVYFKRKSLLFLKNDGQYLSPFSATPKRKN